LGNGLVSGREFDVVEVGFFYEGVDDAFDDGLDDEAGGGDSTRIKTARRGQRDFSLRKPTRLQEQT